MRKTVAAIAMAAGAMIGTHAMAFQIQDGGITAAEVAKVLQDKGYKAEITTDNEGDPEVKSSTDGGNFAIFFYGCNKGPRCSSIEFQAGYDLPNGMSLDKINQWNKEHRFLRAYLDKDNDPYAEMDLDVEHAFLTEGLANNIDTWAAVLPKFKQFIGFK